MVVRMGKQATVCDLVGEKASEVSAAMVVVALADREVPLRDAEGGRHPRGPSLAEAPLHSQC